MIWPFRPGALVTDGYDTERANGLHRAWDVSAPAGAPIVAPSNGLVLYLFLVRAGTPLPGLVEAASVLSHEAARYPWYFADRYGACTILVSDERWWLFSHMDLIEMFDAARRRAIQITLEKWRDPQDASRFIECYSSANDRPLPAVQAGEVIGFVGDSGYSTGPHCHMEVCPPGYEGGAVGRIDPGTLFPEHA